LFNGIWKIKSYWTISYLYAKFCRFIFEFSNRGTPWITKDAISFLEKHLESDFTGLEWGSGRSTVWFSKKIKFLYSVEHNEEWYLIVRDDLLNQNIDNVSLVLANYQENKGDIYVNAFDLGEEMLDFILVDGKIRDKCSQRALKLLKSGGFLVVDNVNRYIPNQSKSPDSLRDLNQCATPYWEEFYNITINWNKVWTSDGITDTAIYIKP